MKHFLAIGLVAGMLPCVASAESIDLFGSGTMVSGHIAGMHNAAQTLAIDPARVSAVARPTNYSEIQSVLDDGGMLVIESSASAVLIPAGQVPAQVLIPGSEPDEVLQFRLCELLGSCANAQD